MTIGLVIDFIHELRSIIVIVMGFRDLIFNRREYIYFNDKNVLAVKMFNARMSPTVVEYSFHYLAEL